MMTNGDVEYRMASGAFLVSLRSSFGRVTGVMAARSAATLYALYMLAFEPEQVHDVNETLRTAPRR